MGDMYFLIVEGVCKVIFGMYIYVFFLFEVWYGVMSFGVFFDVFLCMLKDVGFNIFFGMVVEIFDDWVCVELCLDKLNID